MPTFLEKLQQKGESIVLRLEFVDPNGNTGVIGWHCFMQLPDRNLDSAQRTLKEGGDIRPLGTVLEEGPGKPDPERIRYYKDKYGLKNP